MSAAIPNAAHSAGGRRPGTPLFALAAGAVFGGLQAFGAQHVGLLQLDSTRSDWLAVTLSTLTWLSAASVIVGVLAAARFGGRTDSGRGNLLTLSAAALGGLFAVPFATSAAAWGAMYGGAISATGAGVNVVVGIALGVVCGALVQRYRSVAVGLSVGIGVVWAVALLSVLLDPGRPPVLGHPGVSSIADATVPRVGALLVALVSGLGIGVVWTVRPTGDRVAAAVAGPALVAAVFVVSVPIASGWPWSPIPSALLAVPCAVLGATLGAGLALRLRPGRAGR